MRVPTSIFAVTLLGCIPATPPPAVPTQDDWIEVGVVLRGGEEGDWDVRLAGASSPSTVLRHDGRIYLYYGGADGPRREGGPRHRAVGVATSPDGVRFTKHPGNPVMTHRPHEGEEEGANSAGVARLDGRFVMAYGAATQITHDQIVADGRIAASDDGLTFEDLGVLALDHDDDSLYGSGDEIFPLALYRHDETRYVFYAPNGTPESRDLAVAWGPSLDRLERSGQVLDADDAGPVRMGGNVTLTGDGRLLLFVLRRWHPDSRIEVRLAPAADPTKIGEPLAVYDAPLWRERTKLITVWLDETRRTWFLYRLDWEQRIVLHTAPWGPRDETPPSPPAVPRLGRDATGATRLTWSAATDPDTGVAGYRVYRDGERIAQTVDSGFMDAGAADLEDPVYGVSAFNLHGVEGPQARPQAAD